MKTEQPQISDEQLQSIALLAEKQVQLEQARELLSIQMDHLMEELQQVKENLLPDAMMALGLESFVLKSGYAVCVDKFYAGKIPDDRSSEAFAWLRTHGLESIIKREVKLVFGKGEDDRATETMIWMRKQGLDPVDKTGVHPQTLKSFIRERMENGQELPNELFGVFVGNRAKVTPPKK